MRLLVASCLALLAAFGCSGEQEDPLAGARAHVIDEIAGSYRGVKLGDSARELQRVFGTKEPAGENEPAIPAGLGVDDEEYGPSVIPYGRFGPSPTAHYRYDEAVFGFVGGRLRWFETIEPGAATNRGVAIGDPLATVQDAYEEATCGTAGGGDYPEYPACAMKLAPERWIWFGGDPIGSITVGAVPLLGVTEEKPFTGRVFTLEDGEFVTYPPGEAKRGDKIICEIAGKRIEAIVPRPGAGVSVDPMYVATNDDGSVRAECGGIHAETGPPGSW